MRKNGFVLSLTRGSRSAADARLPASANNAAIARRECSARTLEPETEGMHTASEKGCEVQPDLRASGVGNALRRPTDSAPRY